LPKYSSGERASPNKGFIALLAASRVYHRLCHHSTPWALTSHFSPLPEGGIVSVALSLFLSFLIYFYISKRSNGRR